MEPRESSNERPLDPLDQLHAALRAYDESTGSWNDVQDLKRSLRDQGHGSFVDHFEDQMQEAADARGYW